MAADRKPVDRTLDGLAQRLEVLERNCVATCPVRAVIGDLIARVTALEAKTFAVPDMRMPEDDRVPDSQPVDVHYEGEAASDAAG